MERFDTEHSRKRSAASATAHRLALGIWGLFVGGEKWREHVSSGPRPLLVLRQTGQLAGDMSNGALRFMANRVPSKRRPRFRSGLTAPSRHKNAARLPERRASGRCGQLCERHRLLCKGAADDWMKATPAPRRLVRLVIKFAGLYPPAFRVRVSVVTSNEATRITSPGCFVYKPNNLTCHQALIVLVMFSAPPALMATFTASSIGSLKGTSIRSRPCS